MRGVEAVEGAYDSGGQAPLVSLPEIRDELLDILAHELRSPLNAARWLAEVVRASSEDLSPEEVRRAMESLLRSVGYMESLLQSLLAEADNGAAHVQLHRQATKVDDLARETVEDMSAVLHDRLVAVSVEGPVLTWADPDRLRQALIALLVNATRYSPSGTPISVRVAGRAKVVEVAVADHCSGIAPQDQERIFARHGRLDHAGEGSGLGLFVARRLARAHGGDLRVTSDGAWGCRFTLTLPRLAPA